MDENNNVLLQIKDLEVIYKSAGQTVRAVNTISFTINKGETLGLVGETGAGKTTTALSIMRLLPDRAAKVLKGQILFEGEDLLAADERKMREIRGEKISMIFQDPMTALNPVMTVGNQIEETLKYHIKVQGKGITLSQKVDEALEMVGIPASRKNDYPHEFSGGMKQRVLIAIALACNPDLLIADEPTTALDVTIQSQVLSMIDDLHERFRMGMLLITHDLGIIAEMSDNVAVMYAGEIIEYGSVHELFDRSLPHHPYTEGLFNSIPDLKSKTKRLTPIDGLMPDPTALPEGCSFSPRCPYCTEACKNIDPPVWQNGAHSIKCHRFDTTEVQ